MSESFPRPESFEESVVVYGTLTCGFCAMAKLLLTKRGLAYGWFNVASNPEAREWLQEVSGQRTVPQIFINGNSIGGFSELRALDEGGELKTQASAGE